MVITEATNVSIDQFCFDPDISCQDTVYRDVVRSLSDKTFSIYSCFDKGCAKKNVKAYAKMPEGSLSRPYSEDFRWRAIEILSFY